MIKENSGTLMKLYRNRRWYYVVVTILLITFIFWIYKGLSELSHRPTQPTFTVTLDKDFEYRFNDGNKHIYTLWPKFRSSTKRGRKWYIENCWHRQHFSLENLTSIIEELKTVLHPDCVDLHRVITTIFSINKKPANVHYPFKFAAKVTGWLGKNKQLVNDAYHQTITSVYNEFTDDNTNYNSIRDKRPITKSAGEEKQYIEEIVMNSSKNCDFCNYNTSTAEDEFGRIHGEMSYTAANAFRWDRWHSLIIPRNHHPVKWTRKEFMDLMLTNRKWQTTVYHQEHEYKYPMTLWDLFFSGGASQLHPHLQSIMHSDRYYGTIENWRRAADRYNRQFSGRNYFNDLVLIHEALGLTVHRGGAVVLASITPKKDYEIVILSEKADDDFNTMLYYAVRTYFDEMHQFAFSMAIAFPTMSPEDTRGVIPAYARLVARGPVKATRSDIGALELLSVSNVNTDPYKLIRKIRDCIRKKESVAFQ